MMNLEKIKNQTFAAKTTTEWKKAAEASLRGKSVESLQTNTYETIILKPLYSKRDELQIPAYSGGSDFRRGIYPLGYLTNEWKVAQQLSYQTPEELQEKLHQSFEKGQTAISFEVKKELLENESLVNILGDSYNQYPFSINAKGFHSAFLSELTKITEREGASRRITGYIGSDPIAIFAEEGGISEGLINDWLTINLRSNLKFPNLRTILIDTVPYHNGGANAVQELGIAIAEGVYYLEKLQEAEMERDEILSKMIFQFSVGGNYFMEIAKLRAARILWNRVTEAYGAKGDRCGMHIAAATSTFTKTVHDPHVNLLRSGNEAFAAVVGGVQYLHVNPFDDLTGATPFSERIARNTQLLLKEEAILTKVIDPVGGSWYVEELTNQLAEKSWAFFQQIDAMGGILEVLKSNWLQQEISATYDKKNRDILTRKQSMIGTNVYANLDENIPELKLQEEKSDFNCGESSFINIEAVPQRRLAEPFEELRRKSKDLESLGMSPEIGMICLGELKRHKSRLDFMKGFLAAGGIKTVDSSPVLSLENARQFVADHPAKHFCLCGTNDQYEIFGAENLKSLTAEFQDRILYLAGLPEKEQQSQWLAAGIKQFIHVNSNCYETLSTILKDLEVNLIEEPKA
jgi:methylmalonyl-CoA mutase